MIGGRLWRWVNKFSKRERKNKMLLRNVSKLVEELRALANIIRPNNKKVSEWVATYLNDCALNGRPVTILSQWCLSKDLERRFEKTGRRFEPTKKELRLFAKEVPNILAMFERARLKVVWNFTFNLSYLDSGRIDREMELAYTTMIRALAKDLVSAQRIALYDWEEEVLGSRPEPSQEVLKNLAEYVSSRALALELERHSRWAKEDAGLNQGSEEIRRDVSWQIACEAEEGRWLLSKDSMIDGEGRFLLVPFEAPERYDFFELLAPNFKQRIVSIVHLYPWRSE